MDDEASLSVEDVIATKRLGERPGRPPDFARESRMLGALAGELAERPENLLQRLCDLVVEEGVGQSAGVSLDEEADGTRRFRWAALSGLWGRFRGGTMPVDASPCGVVVAHDQPMLFESPERFFPAARVEPLIREVLLVPFHAEGRPVGTLWINSHDPGRTFDAEDARLLQNLSRFASAGYGMERRVAQRAAALRESDERQAFLLSLSDALRPLTDPVAIQAAASRLLGERLGVSRALYAEMSGEPGAEAASVQGEYVRAGEPMPPRHPASAFGEPLIAVLRRGDTLVMPDAQGDPRLHEAEREAFGQVGVGAAVAVPLVKDGRWTAVFTVHNGRPRAWAASEVELVGEVAERTWSAVERARAEAALRTSEERLQVALAAADLGAWVWHVAEDRTEADARALAHFGLPPDGPVTLAEALATTFHPDDGPRYAAAVARAIDPTGPGTLHEEYRIRRPDGQERWMSTIATTAFEGTPPAAARMTGVLADVTERKRAEAALRESEALFRQFAEASTGILWIRGAEGLRMEYASPAFEATYGFDPAAAGAGGDLGNWTALLHPDDRGRVLDDLRRVRDGERMTHEFRMLRPDGEERWIRNTDFPLRDAAGRVERIGGIGEDVTAGKLTALRLDSLIEGIPQLVWRSEGEGRWTWASRQWLAFTGQSEEACRGLGWLDAIHPDDRARTMAAWRGAEAAGLLDVEHRIRRASDGSHRWFTTRSSPVRDETTGAKVEWLGTSTDVQDLKELQERQGVLVAELQHRTRNLMGVVRSTMDATLRRAPTLEGFVPAFRGRIAALARVQGLLSRLGEGDRITFDELIVAELSAVGAVDAAGRGERVELHGPKGVRLRSGTVQTFALALHELATNATKYGALAQPGGHLAVRWRRTRGADGPGNGPGNGPGLRVEWTETGIAMPEPGAAPQGSGYGRELIERALPYQLGAETTYELGPAGVRCIVTLPLLSTREEADAWRRDA